MDKAQFIQQYQEAQRWFQEGKFREALAILDGLNRAAPTNKDILYARCVCLAKLGKVSEAGLICDHLMNVLNDPRGAQLKATLGEELFPEWNLGGTSVSTPRAPTVGTPERPTVKRRAIRRVFEAMTGAIAAIFLMPRKAEDAARDLSPRNSSAPAGGPSGEEGTTVLQQPRQAASTSRGKVPLDQSKPGLDAAQQPGAAPTRASFGRAVYRYSGAAAAVAGLAWLFRSPLRAATSVVALILLAVIAAYFLHARAESSRGRKRVAVEPLQALSINFGGGGIASGHLWRRPWNAPRSTRWNDIGYASGQKDFPASDELQLELTYRTSVGDVPAGLSMVRGLRQVKLRLGKLSPEFPSLLKRLPDVTAVDLANSPVDDDSLQFLEGLPFIEELNLANTNIGDAGLAHLKELRNLRYLNLSRRFKTKAQITNAGMQHLAALAGLEELDLSYNESIGAEVAGLVGLKNLRSLNISGTGVSMEDIAHLKDMPNLATLSMGECRIDGDRLGCLAQFPKLQTLEIGGNGPAALKDEKDFEVLEGMPSLKNLKLLRQVNGAGFRRLQTARPDLVIGGRFEVCDLFQFPEDRSVGLLDRREARGALLVPARRHDLVIAANAVNDLSWLSSLAASPLDGISLRDARIPAGQLQHVAKVTNLHDLEICDSKLVGDEGFAPLAGLPKLDNLRLQNCDLGETGLKGISALENLSRLFLNRVKVPVASTGEIAALKKLNELEMEQCPIGKAFLEGMGNLGNLQWLHLRACRPESMTVAGWERMQNLMDLDLQGTPITDEHLATISRLSHLRGINLRETKITDKGLDRLRALTDLGRLNLARLPITDAALASLSDMKKLWELDLLGTRITGDGLAYLKNQEWLVHLSLGFTRDTFKGSSLAYLKQFPLLDSLTLWNSGVKDDDLRHLSTLTKLRGWLNLSENPITDAGLIHLRDLTKLHYLYLNRTKVRGTGLGYLSEMKSLRELQLVKSDLTNEAVPRLQKMTSLKKLDLQGTKIRREGAEMIRQALPRCEIWATVESPEGPRAAQITTRRDFDAKLLGIKSSE
jgi:Leucine-rich repeat (LRR) protein